MEIILVILLTLSISASFVAIRNLIKKNEAMEDFINKQSEAIAACDTRLKEVDNKIGALRMAIKKAEDIKWKY